MTADGLPIDELRALADAACDGTLRPRDAARLEELLHGRPEAQRFYLACVRLDGCLRWEFGQQAREVGLGVGDSGFGAADSELPQVRSPQSRVPSPESPALEPELLIPPIIIDTSSPLSAPAAFPFTVGGWLFSYAAATVITGMAILGAWLYKVSLDYQLAGTPRPSSAVARQDEQPGLVGRITGMVDCQWTDPQSAPVGRNVALGQAYSLSSGLMEICYNTGAKVILQGPCSYEIESSRGGFLSLGKLTARVESTKAQAADPKSQIPNPKFVVRTPTAVVTDLGTEFGVEVENSGATHSHVFRGRIEVRPAAGTKADGRAVSLGADESARVELDRDRVVRVTRGGTPFGRFARRMPQRVPIKLFNTGVGLDEGQPDPHWQLVARSDDPHFKPRAAFVAAVSNAPAGMWLANEPSHSQWIAISSGSVWRPTA